MLGRERTPAHLSKALVLLCQPLVSLGSQSAFGLCLGCRGTQKHAVESSEGQVLSLALELSVFETPACSTYQILCFYQYQTWTYLMVDFGAMRAVLETLGWLTLP